MIARRQAVATGSRICGSDTSVGGTGIGPPAKFIARLVRVEVGLGAQRHPDHGELDAEPREVRLELERLALDVRPVLSLQALLLDLCALLGLLAQAALARRLEGKVA